MCGIAGIILRNPRQDFRDTLAAMASAMSHRGPDSHGVQVDGNFGCAHARLSIVDLSPAGNQPFSDPQGVLAYNGEIYNHAEIRKEMRLPPDRFQGCSDTATLFVCLQEWGVERTLRRIRGMFAFSWYDRRSRELYLCRDRFGIKPLLWKQEPGVFAFASEAKALAPAVSMRPDPIRVLHSLSGIAENSPRLTVFKDVFQVRPGTFLKVDSEGEAEERSYYSLAAEVSESRYRELSRLSMAEASEELTCRLSSSIQSMLMSDLPMGVFASGGIDSSVIAALAHRHTPGISLFTSNIVGPLSEFRDAQTLARYLDLPLHESRFEAEEMMQRWAKCTQHYEAPIVTHTNSIPFSKVAGKARESGIKSVLTGEGSDELFLGYPGLLAQRMQPVVAAPLNALKGLYSLLPSLKRFVVKDDQTTDDFLGLLVQGFERQRTREATMDQVYGFLPSSVRREHYQTIQMFNESLLALLHRNDRMGMSASIEARFPFLDEDLVAFALNLPMRFKIGFTRRFHNWKHPFLEDKAIVRRVADKTLPRSLARKKKLGFPMLGHRHMQVSHGYFRHGYVSELLSLNAEAQDYLTSTQSHYFLAKLVSIDVFGRLFSMGESPERVTEHLQQWTIIKKP